MTVATRFLNPKEKRRALILLGTIAALAVYLLALQKSQTFETIELPNRAETEKHGRLINWHGKAYEITGSKLHRIDLALKKCIQEVFPTNLTPIYFDISQDGRLMGVTKNEQSSSIFIEEGNSWKTLPPLQNLEEGVHSEIALAAEGNKVVAIFQKRLHTWDGQKWSVTAAPQIINFNGLQPDELILKNDKLYMSANFGEWGGGEYLYDYKDGKCAVLYDQFPVTCMRLDGSGNIWFTSGFTFLSSHDGGLYKLVGLKPRLHLGTNGDKDSVPFKTAFYSFAFEPSGNILISTIKHGVIRANGITWESALPAWANCSYQSNLTPLSNDCLVFYDDQKGLVSAASHNKYPIATTITGCQLFFDHWQKDFK